MSLLSFVLLNWNSGPFLRRALESLAEQSHDTWELVCVDNGSTGPSVSLLEEFERRGVVTELIRLDRNYGFAEGMNRGIAKTRGDLVVPLNSDVCVERNFVEAVLGWFGIRSRESRDGSVGMIAVPVYRWRFGTELDVLTDELEKVGVCLVRRLSASPWHPAIESRDTLLAPAGAAPIFTRTALEAAAQLGGSIFDSSYVAYGEDIDLFIRLRALGYGCDYCLDTRIWHIGSASTGGDVQVTKKVPALRAMVHANKWRTFSKLAWTPRKLAMLPWMILEDSYNLLVGSSRLALLRLYLRNYVHLARRRTRLRYPPFRMHFGGAIFSAAGRYLRRYGRLPPL